MALLSRSLAPWAATVATAVVGLVTPAAAWANQFGQQPIDPNLAIPVATPVRDGAFYNLMILEQVPNQRQCWQEQSQADGPTVVDPLLLNFNFAGACDRKTDSNGYSVASTAKTWAFTTVWNCLLARTTWCCLPATLAIAAFPPSKLVAPMAVPTAC